MRVHGTKLGAISTGRGLGDQFYDLAGQIPSLDLKFSATNTLDSSINFTRASTATYVDSSGLVKTAAVNEARFSTNPITGESLGLLVEEAKTNLLIRSEEFNNPTWGKTVVSVTADTSTAPDGNTTSDDVTVTTNTTVQGITTAVFTADGTSNYTFSIFVKKTSSSGVNLALYFRSAIGSGNSYSTLNFNTQTGFVSFALGSSTSGTYLIQDLGSWWRISTTAGGIPAGNMRAHVRLNSQAVGTTITLWGAQLETGAFVTSYIPTTSSTVTRAADVVQITGANFSNFYNQSQGTVFAEYQTPASGIRSIVGFNDSTTNERLVLYTDGTDPKMLVIDAGVTQANLDGGTIIANTVTKTAMAYSLNDFSIVHATGAAVTDTSGTLPVVNRLLIGSDQAGNYQNSSIKRLTYWSSRLSDTTLQQITQ